MRRIPLFRKRRPFSMAEACKATGKTPRHIRRLAAQPRTEYEENSITSRQPWVQEGISRATWYRRQRRSREQEKE